MILLTKNENNENTDLTGFVLRMKLDTPGKPLSTFPGIQKAHVTVDYHFYGPLFLSF